MKRILSPLLLLLLCCSLFGCQTQKNAPVQSPVVFFYPQSSFSFKDADCVIGNELREAAGHEDDLVYLLDLYLSGPQSETLAQPFPPNCYVISCASTSFDTITLVVSDSFAALTGIELTVSCVCLAKTLSGLTEADTVIIQARTQLLDGKKHIAIQNGASVLTDDYIASATYD